MDNIWIYIIGAVIYFLTRGKKKKQEPAKARPTQSNRPQQQAKPVSFEDLLKEITEGREEEQEPEVEEEYVAPVVEEKKEEPVKKERARHFADEESRRIYEESIKVANEIDLDYAPDEHYKSKSLFRKDEAPVKTFADEIRESLQTDDGAKKAIIYSEILNKKY